MITRITKANADKYRVLFAEAVEALQTHDENGHHKDSKDFSGKVVLEVKPEYVPVDLTEDTFIAGLHYIEIEEGKWELTALDAVFLPEAKYAICIDASEKITTLEEYFCYIADLRAINKKFTILPLEDDENFFMIDANSRKIEIPKSFKDNGVAVQGDEIAEILYFKIDRFFDMDDLATKEAYIQWRAPADKEGNRKEGVSIPWVYDAYIDPGHVIIGWPLSSEITENPGKVDFAVRFYSIPDEGADAGKLMYSLSTLTATADIKEGLNYDLERISADGSAISSDNLIINRLVNSSKENDNTPDPIPPIFIAEDEVIEAIGGYELVSEEDAKYKTYKVYMTNPATGEEEDGLFKVQAYVTDSGVLGYTWFKRDVENELVQENVVSGNIFELTDDTERNTNKIYYTKGENDMYPVFNFTEEIPDLAAAAAAGIQLYERKSRIIMNVSGEDVLGTYQVRAANRLGRKTARTFGNIALVEGPEVPEITTDIGEKGTFSGEGLDLPVSVVANLDAHAYTTYQLQRSETEDGDYEFVGNPSTSNQFVIDGGEYEAEDDGDGFYRVVIESKLNSVVKSATGEPMRVTHAATPVTITTNAPTVVAGGSSKYDINQPLIVTATPHESEKRIEDVDSITYQWYKYNAEQGNLLQDLDAAANGLYVVQANDTALKDATTATLNIVNTLENEEGHYFCQITNTYNGTTAVKCSKFFDVIDTKTIG